MKTELIPHLFKTEHAKLIAVLCKKFGLGQIEIAEDISNDTFLLAAETWGLKGIPPNPTAWLYTVAQNKTKDYLKRNKLFEEKIAIEVKQEESFELEQELDFSIGNIEDSQLKMIFSVCNAIIPKEAQVGLALRILCGFGIDEIADAFLSNKETINKRLFRAKEKLRTSGISMEMPPETEINERLASVLSTLYLLFNEGYYSSNQNESLRKELCWEAMRLNQALLQSSVCNTSESNALMALMCFHASRFEARKDSAGELVLYEDQNSADWDEALIEKGEYFLNVSALGQQISKYHLEAAIAYCHTNRLDSGDKWETILYYYNLLLQIEYSPVTALNSRSLRTQFSKPSVRRT
jgi:RNA polymerase sigma factor (sigma-70 family)